MGLLKTTNDALPPRCGNCGLSAWEGHACPEAFPFETAKRLLEVHAATRIPMSSTTYARCLLAYKIAGREV